MLPLVRECRRLYLAYLSKPSGDRPVFRFLRKQRVNKILELGIGTGHRTLRMLELAAGVQQAEAVAYTGVDLFESRSSADGPGLTLKRAHQQLRASGARVRLVPGDPFSALARTANELGAVDLIVISADQEPQSLARAWFYFPRLLHAKTHVFLEEPAETDGQFKLASLSRDEINERVLRTAGRRIAA